MPIWSDKRCGWLALRMIQGLGNVACKNLVERFGHPDRIFQSSVSELLSVEGVRKDVALDIIARRYDGDPQAELKKAEDHGARIVTYDEPSYPKPLKEIHDPPMLFYLKGNDIPANMTFIAMVGSRTATHYGLKAAERIGQGLARRGLGIVSGMARGIDSASHWGCLSGLGFTIAVLGTGIDIIYPISNKKLYHLVIEKGAVISEFPMGTPPAPTNFPIRNRIISGLSTGVIVVEATKNSGSLITAAQSLDQGREVFAVPGSIDSFKSAGCHFLIKQGARLIENSDDVLEELGLNYPYIPKTDTFKKGDLPAMDESEKVIFDMIGDYPMHIDEISRQGNMEPKEVSSILTRMELKGMIRQLPGKMFVH